MLSKMEVAIPNAVGWTMKAVVSFTPRWDGQQRSFTIFAHDGADNKISCAIHLTAGQI